MFGHKRRGCWGRTSDEILGPHYRQSLDVRAALQASGFQSFLVFKAFWFLMTANALCGLLSNDPTDGGAEIGVRRLYEGVIHSRVLYGAPVWAEDLMKSLHSLLLLRRLHRTTAIRFVRGYRTLSYASATVLAASPSLELQALVLRRVYEDRRSRSSSGDSPPPRVR